MLVDGQGNFGSIDGVRGGNTLYAVIWRKSPHELMAVSKKRRWISWMKNYDGTEKFGRHADQIPNLLVNGSSGIAVGMATNIPPHSLTEVINGCTAYIDEHQH